MKDKKKLKKYPVFETDKEAEKFVAEADLAEFDVRGFEPVKFEFKKKSERINMRIPQDLLAAVKAIANKRGMPYTRYIREVLESHIQRTHDLL